MKMIRLGVALALLSGATILTGVGLAEASCKYTITQTAIHAEDGFAVTYDCGNHGWQCLYDQNGDLGRCMNW